MGAVLFLLGCLGAGAQDAHAQLSGSSPGFGEISYWSIGYVANAPSQLLGVGASILPIGLEGWGLYADFKTGSDSPRNRSSFDPALTSAEAELTFPDEVQRTQAHWTTGNVGVVRALTPDFAVYGGAGFSRQTLYHEYLDTSRERGVGGFYWVEDDLGSGNAVNVLGGALLRFGQRLIFQLGGESAPAGFSVGVSVAPPYFW